MEKKEAPGGQAAGLSVWEELGSAPHWGAGGRSSRGAWEGNTARNDTARAHTACCVQPEFTENAEPQAGSVHRDVSFVTGTETQTLPGLHGQSQHSKQLTLWKSNELTAALSKR